MNIVLFDKLIMKIIMKRNVFSLIVVLMATVSFVNVWISVTSTNKKMKIRLAAIEAMAMIEAETPGDTELLLAGACKITSNCYNWAGTVDGRITCWGADYCKRGIRTEGTVFIKEIRWVECDGKKTEC